MLLCFFSCQNKNADFGPQKLGGKWVSTNTLELGQQTYMTYCVSCHGVSGDGKGPASIGAHPPPRNFQKGLYKFAFVESGSLPRDEDLKRTIRYGLRGTPMLPWDISDKRLDAVVQYIKTFSPVWKENEAGQALEMSEDPWGAKLASQAIEQGRKVYNGVAQCYACHPYYSSLEQVNKDTQEILQMSTTEFARPDPWNSVLSGSEYDAQFMPPDYTKNWIRSGSDIKSIYRVLAAGVNGTAMTPWKGMLSLNGDEVESEKNLWAVAYYVNSLQMLKYDWKNRHDFVNKLHKQLKEDVKSYSP